MRKFTTILIALLVCAGTAYPALMLEGKTLPTVDCFALEDAWIRVNDDGEWYHDMKNLITESVRCDPQWWGKVLSSVIVVLMVSNIFFMWLLVREGKNNNGPR